MCRAVTLVGAAAHAVAREKGKRVVDRDAGLLIGIALERVHPDEVAQRFATRVVRRESTSHEATVGELGVGRVPSVADGDE